MRMTKKAKAEIEAQALAENRKMMQDMMRKSPLEAAAPDMYEALTQYLESLEVALKFISPPGESKAPDYTYDFIHRHKTSPVVQRMRAAIAKADGITREEADHAD